MSNDSVETPGDEPGEKPSAAAPAVAAPAVEKRFRRTTLSTGFSDGPGKTCQVCGFQGFRWQKTCPQGHPLA